jgi:N-acetylmuramic acid 6-phosphate etherase
VQPKNAKLADRARRIVAVAAEVGPQRSAELLEASGGRVAVAIMMSRKNCAREEAERMLIEAGGRVSRALAPEDDGQAKACPTQERSHG